MPSFRRLQFLLTAGVAVGAALLKGCALNPPSPNSMSALADVLPPSPATMPEVPGIRLGYIAIAESAPLIIAQEKGFFTRHGMPDVKIAKQASGVLRGIISKLDLVAGALMVVNGKCRCLNYSLKV